MEINVLVLWMKIYDWSDTFTYVNTVHWTASYIQGWKRVQALPPKKRFEHMEAKGGCWVQSHMWWSFCDGQLWHGENANSGMDEQCYTSTENLQWGIRWNTPTKSNYYHRHEENQFKSWYNSSRHSMLGDNQRILPDKGVLWGRACILKTKTYFHLLFRQGFDDTLQQRCHLKTNPCHYQF